MDFRRTPPQDVAAARTQVFSIPFDELARFSLDGFCLIDADGKVVAWSDVTAAQTAISATDALGKRISEIFVNTEALIRSGDAPAAIQIGIAREKPTRWVRATALALADGWLVSFGPQRRFDRIEQLKNELLAVISHEVNTPIATVKAVAALLREEPDMAVAQRTQYLDTIDEQSDRLARAVERLLRAARVDADQLPARRERCTLDTILDAALAHVGAHAQARRYVRDTAGIEVSGDPDLLRELFAHLIENAVKFSAPESEIEVAAHARNGSTTISLRDHGIGIEREHLPYIFERFYRVEANLTAATGGYGLGLYIVDALVRAHSGTIAVESEPNLGTTVTLEIPERL